MALDRPEQLLRYLAGNLRQQRARLGLTQEALAARAKMDLRYLQRIERAQVNLTMLVLGRLAIALEVEPGALLEEAELPPPRHGRPPGSPSGEQGS